MHLWKLFLLGTLHQLVNDPFMLLTSVKRFQQKKLILFDHHLPTRSFSKLFFTQMKMARVPSLCQGNARPPLCSSSASSIKVNVQLLLVSLIGFLFDVPWDSVRSMCLCLCGSRWKPALLQKAMAQVLVAKLKQNNIDSSYDRVGFECSKTNPTRHFLPDFFDKNTLE